MGLHRPEVTSGRIPHVPPCFVTSWPRNGVACFMQGPQIRVEADKPLPDFIHWPNSVIYTYSNYNSVSCQMSLECDGPPGPVVTFNTAQNHLHIMYSCWLQKPEVGRPITLHSDLSSLTFPSPFFICPVSMNLPLTENLNENIFLIAQNINRFIWPQLQVFGNPRSFLLPRAFFHSFIRSEKKY